MHLVPPNSPISNRYQTRIRSKPKQLHTSLNAQNVWLDRLSPTYKDLNTYSTNFFNLKRFTYDGNHNANKCNINPKMVNRSTLSLSTSERKRRRKLTELATAYRSNHDTDTRYEDLTSLNEKVKEKMAFKTYNQCIKCELFGAQSKRSAIGDKTDSHYFTDDETESDPGECLDDLALSTVPSLPTYRACETTNPNIRNHHPLCPRFEESNRSGSRCRCNAITGNAFSDFLASPQRTLQYKCKENIMKKVSPPIRCSPITISSQQSLCSNTPKMRSISKTPYKILDAPGLSDDFYLNLVSWSASCNILSVGLSDCVYLWNPVTSDVTKLCDLNAAERDTVCSVDWNVSTGYNDSFVDRLGIGTNLGSVLIYDTAVQKQIGNLTKHEHRVSALSWRDGHMLTSGSRDKQIFLRDIRQRHDVVHELCFHKQEVCGLKWNHNNSVYLCSGGNDNKLHVYDIRALRQPVFYGKHRAAVKAMAWSNFNSNLLCTGGGTACRSIKVWDIGNADRSTELNGSNRIPLLKPIKTIDTGSQVCNLLWSETVNEIVSTHGYSLNQIIVWKYPTMQKVVTLTDHTYRVLYLSGCGNCIVTGAADQTLRLWNIFPHKYQKYNDDNSLMTKLYPRSALIR
eukprot:973003_1